MDTAEAEGFIQACARVLAGDIASTMHTILKY